MDLPRVRLKLLDVGLISSGRIQKFVVYNFTGFTRNFGTDCCH
jgi:hypothetical protein